MLKKENYKIKECWQTTKIINQTIIVVLYSKLCWASPKCLFIPHLLFLRADLWPPCKFVLFLISFVSAHISKILEAPAVWELHLETLWSHQNFFFSYIGPLGPFKQLEISFCYGCTSKEYLVRFYTYRKKNNATWQ